MQKKKQLYILHHHIFKKLITSNYLMEFLENKIYIKTENIHLEEIGRTKTIKL